MPNLAELNEIRIIVNKGRGFGHQKAGLTTMLKLRELGFNGTFDIRYLDLYPYSWQNEQQRKEVGCTGRLSPVVFDELMLTTTTLPPVIEGCNSIETCEAAGRLYLHGSKKRTTINPYASISHPILLELHKEACLPLEQGAEEVGQLADFMNFFQKGCLEGYAKARRNEHLSRPDIFALAFDIMQRHEKGLLPLEERPRKIQKRDASFFSSLHRAHTIDFEFLSPFVFAKAHMLS